MIDRTPPPRDQRPALPAFDPVPRKCKRHDGWTPDRQRAFIEALADTGSVATAARMVNMSSESAYYLRRKPQAGSFAAAWEAATAMGWRRLKDEAFERALNGQLVPVFTAGKLIGYRRRKNDRLLMFILRHYGPDGPAPTARPLTVNVFTAASASVGESPDQSATDPTIDRPTIDRPAIDQPAPGHARPRRRRARADAPGLALVTATPARALVATDPSSPPSDIEPPAADPRDIVATFAGVPLDDEAEAQILAVLTANAARQRALPIEEDPAVAFVHVDDAPIGLLGEMDDGLTSDDVANRKPGEVGWPLLGDEATLTQIDVAVAAVEAAKARGDFSKPPTPPPPPPPVAEGHNEDLWATPEQRHQLAGIDAIIEAAKAEVEAGRRQSSSNQFFK